MNNEASGSQPELKRSARGADLIIPVLAAAFTIYFLVSTWNFNFEARANGVVIGTFLLVLITIQLVRMAVAARSGRTSLALGTFAERSPAQFQRLALIAILIVWIATIAWTGTTLSLVFVMAASMWVLGVRDWKTLVFGSMGTALTVYLVFILLLGSRLPRGIIENTISGMTGGGV